MEAWLRGRGCVICGGTNRALCDSRKVAILLYEMEAWLCGRRCIPTANNIAILMDIYDDDTFPKAKTLCDINSMLRLCFSVNSSTYSCYMTAVLITLVFRKSYL